LLVGKDLGHQKVHQTPQLHHIILKRGASKQEAAFRVESEQGLPPLRLEIFNILRLI
jgi:hypothetical protein